MQVLDHGMKWHSMTKHKPPDIAIIFRMHKCYIFANWCDTFGCCILLMILKYNIRKQNLVLLLPLFYSTSKHQLHSFVSYIKPFILLMFLFWFLEANYRLIHMVVSCKHFCQEMWSCMVALVTHFVAMTTRCMMYAVHNMIVMGKDIEVAMY
jgi:hypothetical protein